MQAGPLAALMQPDQEIAQLLDRIHTAQHQDLILRSDKVLLPLPPQRDIRVGKPGDKRFHLPGTELAQGRGHESLQTVDVAVVLRQTDPIPRQGEIGDLSASIRQQFVDPEHAAFDKEHVAGRLAFQIDGMAFRDLQHFVLGFKIRQMPVGNAAAKYKVTDRAVATTRTLGQFETPTVRYFRGRQLCLRHCLIL